MKTVFSIILAIGTIGMSTGFSQGSPIHYEYVEGVFDYLPDFDSETVKEDGWIDSFDLGVKHREDEFAIRYTTCLVVEYGEVYDFYITSDDGCRLTIDDEVVIDNDGLHPPVTEHGSKYLDPGVYLLVVEYFEAYGDEILELEWSPYGEVPTPLTYHYLKRPEGYEDPEDPETPACPDLCIGKNLSNLVGGGITNNSGRNQVAYQTIRKNQKCCIAVLKNTGSYADDYTLRGTKRDRCFRIKYYDRSAGNANITAAIRRDGYSIWGLEPDDLRLFKICVKPKGKIKYAHKEAEFFFDAQLIGNTCKDRVLCHIKKVPAPKRKPKPKKHYYH